MTHTSAISRPSHQVEFDHFPQGRDSEVTPPQSSLHGPPPLPKGPPSSYPADPGVQGLTLRGAQLRERRLHGAGVGTDTDTVGLETGLRARSEEQPGLSSSHRPVQTPSPGLQWRGRARSPSLHTEIAVH